MAAAKAAGHYPLTGAWFMERHFSVGVATIVALMAAHRAASDREDISAGCLQRELQKVDAYLNRCDRPTLITAHPVGRQCPLRPD